MVDSYNKYYIFACFQLIIKESSFPWVTDIELTVSYIGFILDLHFYKHDYK